MTNLMIAVIAPGAMGAAVAARLVQNGIDVVTSLAGRSAASAARAQKAGMRPVAEAELGRAAAILSIVPPSDAPELAKRLAPLLAAVAGCSSAGADAATKPLYIDCNAVSSDTALEIAATIKATGAPFADGGIIGGPPRAGYDGPSIYVSGVPAGASAEIVARLGHSGLKMKVLDGPVGAASALKMSYASITKGLTAIATASILAAGRYGAAEALHAELSESQKSVLAQISRSVPEMYSKAYRFVGEMEEIAAHTGRGSSEEIYRGFAKLYQEIADDFAGDKRDIAVLEAFFRTRG